MHSLEPEILTAPLDEGTRARLLAIERRAIFSVRPELRIALWLGVVLIATGVGLWLTENIDRIGHGAIITVVAFAAVACYALAWRMRDRGPEMNVDGGENVILSEAAPESGENANVILSEAAPRPKRRTWVAGAETPVERDGRGRSRTPADSSDYLLLLASLLLSADVGYAEAVYAIFDDSWRWHLLILAVVHAFVAYLYDSRLVLSLAVGSLAGWIGVDRQGEFLGSSAGEAGGRLLTSALAVLAWRAGNATVPARRHFDAVLEHFAANFAMWGAIVWTVDDDLRWTGLVILTACAAAAIVVGIRTRREPFVVYALIYFLIGLDIAVIATMDGEVLVSAWLVVTTPLAVAALWILHRRWRREWA